MDIAFPCGKEGVEALLPHRAPFVWVSRILACEPGVGIVAELDVDSRASFVPGTFPRPSRFAGRHHHGGACSGRLVLRACCSRARGRDRVFDGHRRREVSSPGGSRRYGSPRGDYREVLATHVRCRGEGDGRRPGCGVGGSKVRFGIEELRCLRLGLKRHAGPI